MEEKKYHYDKLLFFFDVKLTGGFCIFIILACGYLGFTGMMNRIFLALIALIAFYTVWNCFAAKSTTEVLAISDEAVSFYSLGREDCYPIQDIKRIRIREFPSGGKMYIRINDYGLLKGRYWVQFKKFDEGQEMFRRLLDLEYKLHPDTLKARARRVNTEYLEMEKKKKLSKPKES